ncbi:hypothetical protein LZ30DRAFT_99824 [Colletotrichum cereale]|nr:hypothetical protein LZ30DRAFT_99824 [Colletotrichum cereale]
MPASVEEWRREPKKVVDRLLGMRGNQTVLPSISFGGIPVNRLLVVVFFVFPPLVNQRMPKHTDEAWMFSLKWNLVPRKLLRHRTPLGIGFFGGVARNQDERSLFARERNGPPSPLHPYLHPPTRYVSVLVLPHQFSISIPSSILRCNPPKPSIL